MKKISEEKQKMVADKHLQFMWRCNIMLAMVEHVAYRASDDLRGISDITEEDKQKVDETRSTIVNYIDRAKVRFTSATQLDDEIVLDFYEFIISKTKRKLETYNNAIRKNAKKLGMTQHVEEGSRLITLMKMIEMLNVYRLITSHMPWYDFVRSDTPIERGMQLMDACYNNCSKLLHTLDARVPSELPSNEAVDKQYNDIVDMWYKSDLFAKAMAYAKKENKA